MHMRNCILVVAVVGFAGFVAAQDGEPLELGKSIETKINKENSKWASNWWCRPFPVKLNAGDDLRVKATCLGKVKLQIEVISPAKKKIKVSATGNSLNFSTGPVSADGLYTVRVCANDYTTLQLRVELDK